MSFSPVRASKEIALEYSRYLSSIFSLNDPVYQQQFSARLKEMPFSSGPYLEVTEAFESGKTVREMMNSRFTADDVIRARRVKLTPPPVSKEPPAYFYKEIAAMIEGDKGSSDILAKIHDFDPSLPDEEMEALYQVIYRDPFYWRLRKVLQAPKTLRELVREMGIEENELTAFVTVATRAVHDGAKLFDARYHLFLRAADSVYPSALLLYVIRNCAGNSNTLWEK